MAKARQKLTFPARAPAKPRHEVFTPVADIPLPDKPSLLAAMSDESKVSALINDPATLIVILKRQDHDAEFCYQLMRYITSHPALFEKLFPTDSIIIQIAEEQKNAKKCAGIAVNFLIQNEVQFTRIVNCKAVLENFSNLFSCHASIFKQPTIKAAKTISKTKTNLYQLTLLRKRLTGAYLSIPKPILLQIAAYASDDENKQAAYEQAKNSFRLSH